MKLAYDPGKKLVSGFFEQYTGLDEERGTPRFSCIFYLEGALQGDSAFIHTYFPGNKEQDLINGTIKFLAEKQISIQLQEDHGGCWNVQPFRYKPVTDLLEKSTNWIQIRYVIAPKVYFFSDKNLTQKQKAYLLKDDIVYIESIEGTRAYCTYFGEKQNTTGWIEIKNLNPF